MIAAAGFALAAAAAGTYWWRVASSVPDTSGTGRVLYYQDASGAPFYSTMPKTDAKGRDFVAVRDAHPGSAATQTDGRKVLYYRNPMGLADTSSVPKKDAMGMDYIPVYADEGAASPGAVRLSLDKVQRLGVRTASVTKKTLSESVVLTGTVAANERAQSVVSLRFKANITKLHVSSTGERVRIGQPLFEVHSPFLLQEEVSLAIDLRAREAYEKLGGVYARANATAASIARKRLALYDVPSAEIERLIRTGEPSGRVTWLATRAGTVVEKPVIEGMQVEEGQTLYRITDLSTVWVIAQAPEQALAVAKQSAGARISFAAFPGRQWEGEVTFVYPEIDLATRTARVRIELANPDGLLMPGQFASVDIASPAEGSVLTVPDSAVIDSGKRQVVLLARGEGLFEPRAVRVGRRGGGDTEITSGLAEGEKVVTSATFLIDAESNLKSALAGFTADKDARP